MRGTINREFCVRYDCKNRWFTGCKSRFLQEVDGAKGTFLRVAELCGDALIPVIDLCSACPILFHHAAIQTVSVAITHVIFIADNRFIDLLFIDLATVKLIFQFAKAVLPADFAVLLQCPYNRAGFSQIKTPAQIFNTVTDRKNLRFRVKFQIEQRIFYRNSAARRSFRGGRHKQQSYRTG